MRVHHRNGDFLELLERLVELVGRLPLDFEQVRFLQDQAADFAFFGELPREFVLLESSLSVALFGDFGLRQEALFERCGSELEVGLFGHEEFPEIGVRFHEGRLFHFAFFFEEAVHREGLPVGLGLRLLPLGKEQLEALSVEEPAHAVFARFRPREDPLPRFPADLPFGLSAGALARALGLGLFFLFPRFFGLLEGLLEIQEEHRAAVCFFFEDLLFGETFVFESRKSRLQNFEFEVEKSLGRFGAVSK